MAPLNVRQRVPTLLELLEANKAEIHALHTSRIFTTAAAEPEAAAPLIVDHTAALRDQELEVLRTEVIELRKEVEEANARASTIAECQRRETDIHTTLLRAAHDAAVKARAEAREEASAMRARLDVTEKELRVCRERLSVRLRTAAAEAGLTAAAEAAMRDELVGRRFNPSSALALGDRTKRAQQHHHQRPSPSRMRAGPRAAMIRTRCCDDAPLDAPRANSLRVVFGAVVYVAQARQVCICSS